LDFLIVLITPSMVWLKVTSSDTSLVIYRAFLEIGRLQFLSVVNSVGTKNHALSGPTHLKQQPQADERVHACHYVIQHNAGPIRQSF